MNKDWLDIGILEDYLDGKLDAKTMNRVEREALEDPFVAEALAGLSESPRRSLQSMSLLQKQLHERIAEHQSIKKTSVVTWQRLSIAAAAAVMFIAVSIMFWMRESNHQKELAGRAKKVEVTIAPADTVTTPPIEAAAVIVAETADRLKEKEISKAIKAAKTNAYAANAKAKSNATQSATAAQQLNEVVVGYGVQQKKAITGAVSRAKAAELSNVWSGKVVAQNDGKPLPGVSVRMNGTNLTAVTDVNGEFRINADTSIKVGMVYANYIGFKGVETLAKANQRLSIALKPDQAGLNETVVVGYGAFGKKELSADSNRLNNALAGKAAGIQIRGMSSKVKKSEMLVSNPVGGWDKLFEYINSNNAFANEKKAGQTIELSFRIDQEGSPVDIRIIKRADDKYEREAIRLITNGPKWEKPLNPKSRMTCKLDF